MKQKGIAAEIMAEIDKRAQDEYGISQNTLMENAGRSAFEVILEDFKPFKKESLAVFCGKGNNGGDGFVLARFLAGCLPGRLTVYIKDLGDIREGAAYDNFSVIENMGLDIRPLEDFLKEEDPFSFTIAVDAIFGMGFRGSLPEECASIGRCLNSSKMTVYAVDVPSGLDATTGEASEGCPRAHKTVTFGLAKQGFFLKDGPAVCGQIIVKDIGFPEELIKQYI